MISWGLCQAKMLSLLAFRGDCGSGSVQSCGVPASGCIERGAKPQSGRLRESEAAGGSGIPRAAAGRNSAAARALEQSLEL